MFSSVVARLSDPVRLVPGVPAGVLGWLVVAVIAAALAPALRPPAGATPASSSRGAAVSWRDAGHNWLLVTDRAAHQLVIYDANTGRPLRRIGAGDGVADRVDAIIVRGDRILLQGGPADTSRVLSLPGLKPQADVSP